MSAKHILPSLITGDGDLDARQKRIRIAHGVIMAVVFIAIKPAGALMLRVLPGRLGVKLHVGWQLGGWLLAFSGIGMGLYLASVIGRFGDVHPIVRLVVMVLFIIQPWLGYIHHRILKKEHKRTTWGIIHMWVGRVLIIVGLINGGLGLAAANNTVKGEIAYGVLAGVSAVVYIPLLFLVKMKSRKESTPNSTEDGNAYTSKMEVTA